MDSLSESESENEVLGPSTKRMRTNDAVSEQEDSFALEKKDDYIEVEDDDDDDDDNEDEDSSEESTQELNPRFVPVVNRGPLSVTLSDPDLLDCSICWEPLKIPVYQCENGHIACSICCSRMSNKCPSCALPIGYNRCRVIEKVLEAVKMSCLNAGCTETIKFSQRSLHEKKCAFVPCACPVSDCNFIGPFQILYNHFRGAHSRAALGFSYHTEFTAFFTTQTKSHFFQERNDRTLFVLHNEHSGNIGNFLSISCISPSLPNRKFFCDLRVKGEQSATLQLHCVVKNIQAVTSNKPMSRNYLLVPTGFCTAMTMLNVAVCIWPEHGC